ncbi:GATOR complex protein NPRL3 isoform X2 [Toxorhynchites rutilus septentrionalis]|uniref:GATOR complex protein NPRL3 isoform X2 n=1 Tax=Toxorhynchites rutilus septentrionalis TaxID=329112 RepID=UPI0024797530|nr:GATOR complex protein NPRL3 isoform X2 [Toxorhynchites rutilus septentrionalis]
MEVNPLSILLVKSDSKGDRLLFRYPYTVPQQFQTCVTPARKTPYSIVNNTDDILQNTPSMASNICCDQLYGISDDVFANLFAVKTELCNQKFELKVNDVRFVSHPTLMKIESEDQKNCSYFRVNIVFALHAHASYSIVKCYYELSKRISIALLYEERRACYLSNEMKIMVSCMDEVAAAAQEHNHGSTGNINVFDIILKDCTLAQFIKTVYQDLCTTGLLNVTMNQSVTLSFCLPQKAHQFHKKGIVVEPEAIDRCLDALKPYHGMLLLVDPSELLDCVPPSGARMLLQLIEVYNPLKSLQNMASDADLMIDHVYQLVGHLVYWAKATIIYPLCETNVYVIAPDAQLNIHSNLPDKFSTKFPGMSLFEVISDFSLPTSIGHLTTPLQHPARQGRLAQMVLWMLQHHLLMQLHTYVQFIASYDEESGEAVSGDGPFDDRKECSVELQEINSKQQPSKLNTSLPNPSSQPLAVPTNRKHSLSEELYSDSLTANSNTRPSSASHRSNISHSSVGQTASSTDNDESITSMEDEDKTKRLLLAFDECDRNSILKIPAASNPDDLSLMVRLWQAGYFKGEHHLEEIMYFENLRRSQLLQLVDKFRDVLIIYETEDPAIASLYTAPQQS